MYLKYLPYYNKTTSILFGSGWFIYLWISLNILLTKALETVNYQGQSIVILIGIVLIFPATMQIRNSKIEKKIFNKKHDKIKSEYELDIFIHKLYRLIIDQNVNEVDEMILLGIVHNHQSECLNNECPLNSSEELYLPLTDSVSDRQALYTKDPILLYHLINSIYAEYAKSSNSTAVLHTTYAYFLFYQIGNIHTALLELNVAEKCDTNSQQKFTIYRAKRFIENYLVNKFGKNREMSGKQTFQDLDVTIVITFESLFAKLNKEIEKSANDHIEFWSHLDSQMVDLNVLHKLGLNIIGNTKRINDIWHQLTKINSNYPKALQIYGSYLVQIKNDNTEGEEFLIQANQMARPKSLDEHVNDFELMFADDTAIVVISGNKDSQAKIMKTNNGITKLFGYNTFEVHGHEVNILMPPIIGVKHNYFLEQFFKTGKEKVINSDLETFAMLRVGHIFSITLIVKPVPSLRNDIQYIGLIKPTNKDYDFILTDQHGRIDSISKGITSMLQLQATFFKENEIFIQVLCPQLCEVDRLKGSKDVATKFDFWQGVKDLNFIIPRNFSNLTQKTGGRGGGGGMGNLQKNNENEEEVSQNNFGRRNEQSFVGLKSPDHLKKVCNMFRNNDFKSQPQKYLQNLKNNINYDNPEIFRGPIKTDIINKCHGNGYLQLKVFKILNPKRAGTSGDSDSEADFNPDQGNKNIKALVEECTKKLNDLSSVELDKRILQMKQSLVQIRKGNRYSTKQQKALNISTPNAYEKVEYQKYEREIQQLEQKIKQVKNKREAQDEKDKKRDEDDSPAKLNLQSTNFINNQSWGDQAAKKPHQSEDIDALLQTNSDKNIDYEQIKSQYPLKDHSPMNNFMPGTSRRGTANLDLSIGTIKNPNQVNVNEVSAFQDDSMMQERALLGNKEDMGPDFSAQDNDALQGARDNDGNFYEDMHGEDQGRNQGRPRFKEDFEKLDLLKDIKKKQTDKKKVKKEEKDREEGDSKDGATDGAPEEHDDEKFMDEDTGSVASSTKSLMKHLRMLRNALYENYSPPSIRNLKVYARVVFMALLIITIVWYIYSQNIYQQLKDNIVNIHSSKDRLNSLTNIGADVRVLTAMNQGLVEKERGGRDYEVFKRENLDFSADQLQRAQNELSETYLRDVFTDENNLMINPDSVQLIYNTPSAMEQTYQVDIWSALMAVAVHALTIRDLSLSQIEESHSSVFFILKNTLNNIFEAIEFSTHAILEETQNISDYVNNILSILLYVASGSLFVAICLILPIATKVDKNKDELLRHFMLIDRDDVKNQLEKCRIFFNTMHDKEHVTQQNMGDIDEDEEKEEEGKEAEEGEGHTQGKQKKGKQRSRKNKMHKKFSTNFISLIVKFLIVLTVLEGYFLLSYFLSGSFLTVANNLIQESGSITVRQFSNNFLYQIMQEVLITNGEAQVKNKDSLNYMFSYLNETIKDQEEFLKTHSNNAAFHSENFNAFFDQLIYNNVCDAVYKANDYEECNQFMGGILKKGLYSASVAYWDNMRSMATDFNNSARDDAAISQIMNSDRLVENENLKDIYFATSYQDLLDSLDESIHNSFDDKDRTDTILFACYLVILFLLYFILWRKFIESTRHSLFVTKSMLAIIPLEIIQKVPKIKDFLMASSKNTLSAFKD